MKITPFLWFDHQAQEAAHFYCSIFPNSKSDDLVSYAEGTPTPSGNITSVTFELEGQEFTAFNGGPGMTFSPAISLFVSCQTQAEVDDLWDKLSEGGQPQQCGWVRDKFGVTWQIIPVALGQMLQDPDKAKAGRVLQAMLEMHKIEIDKLQQAFDA